MFRIRSFFKELEPTRQMSEAFRNCIFLALSGGFQDAYTYFTRDGVFANAQTGNVVLMSTNFMTGKWGEGLKYLFPILAFALGVLVADLIQKNSSISKRYIGDREYSCLKLSYCLRLDSCRRVWIPLRR